MSTRSVLRRPPCVEAQPTTHLPPHGCDTRWRRTLTLAGAGAGGAWLWVALAGGAGGGRGRGCGRGAGAWRDGQLSARAGGAARFVIIRRSGRPQVARLHVRRPHPAAGAHRLRRRRDRPELAADRAHPAARAVRLEPNGHRDRGGDGDRDGAAGRDRRDPRPLPDREAGLVGSSSGGRARAVDRRRRPASRDGSRECAARAREGAEERPLPLTTTTASPPSHERGLGRVPFARPRASHTHTRTHIHTRRPSLSSILDGFRSRRCSR